MQLSQYLYTPRAGWSLLSGPESLPSAASSLTLAFGSRELLEAEAWRGELAQRLPGTQLVSCSTSGEIAGTSVFDDTVVATTIQLEHTELHIAKTQVSDPADSYTAGVVLGRELARPGLCYVLLLSDGRSVNGSQLVSGLREVIPADVLITGGLAGDAGRFERTLVGFNGPAVPEQIVAIGFYGDRLRVGHGSMGGWDSFGPQRSITRSSGNVLYELDGKSALELYKRYLGPYAAELPGSALLFPLGISSDAHSGLVTRTILGIDEADQSMIFAGDMPEGARAHFMQASFDKLIEGSESAARESLSDFDAFKPDFALLISCVGRKLILGPRAEEEVEVVRELLGTEVCFAGFYSYGEISPAKKGAGCELHNQTMTITTLKEF